MLHGVRRIFRAVHKDRAGTIFLTQIKDFVTDISGNILLARFRPAGNTYCISIRVAAGPDPGTLTAADKVARSDVRSGFIEIDHGGANLVGCHTSGSCTCRAICHVE